MIENIENGPDFERIDKDFAKDVEKGMSLRQKDQDESKEAFRKLNAEKTESRVSQQSQDALEKIKSLELISEEDFNLKEEKLLSYKISDDNKLGVYEVENKSLHRTLVFTWKKDGKVESRDISHSAYDKMVKMVNDDKEIAEKLFPADVGYSMTNTVAPKIRFEYKKPIIEGTEVTISFEVLTVGSLVLFSNKESYNIEAL